MQTQIAALQTQIHLDFAVRSSCIFWYNFKAIRKLNTNYTKF